MTENRDRLLRKGDYLHGSFLKPEQVDGHIDGVNPGDRTDMLGRFPYAETSVDEAVDAAATGSRLWRRAALADRGTAVRRFRDQTAQQQEAIAQLITREVGKPIWEARQEVLATVRALDLFLDDGIRMLEPRIIEEIGARSDRLPRGVVGVLASFNFPLLLPATHAAAAVLSGNGCVLKPSKLTPGVGQMVAELWDRCKLPRGVFNMVQGPGATIGRRLVANPALDALVFTGTYETATALQHALIDRGELPKVMMTGGKGTAIVLDDAHLDQAVYEVMVGAFLSAGQRQNSTGRVLVTEGVYDAFVDALVRRSTRLSVGYGFDDDVFMGPIVSENLRTRHHRFARKIASKGHVPLIEANNENPGRRGFYASPCIYRIHWENGFPELEDEPPGPMVLVYRVSGWEEAVALHNQSRSRLATSIFTQLDSPVLPEIRERLRTGAININRGTIGASMRLPAVGLGRSSNGLAGGLDLLNVLSTPRSQLVERRPFETMAQLPGVNWSTATPVVPVMEEEDDLSQPLEMAPE